MIGTVLLTEHGTGAVELEYCANCLVVRVSSYTREPKCPVCETVGLWRVIGLGGEGYLYDRGLKSER